MKLLDEINSSADVKRLPKQQLPQLCAELREEIIKDVSATGGHLASSLGAVELTVALHRVYDTAADRVVFDVGHQCYAHKMLTGRRAAFSGLRQYGGISGFPKPCESPDDACIAGHASVSISNALGMARARTLLGADYDVAAVIGDGALTGGTAYEGLADCGSSGEPIVVILNDNAMSISENVGGMAKLLAKTRVRSSYIAFKRFYRRTIGRIEHLYRFLHRIKEWVKDLLMPDNMFEDMGFYYLGPIDGHDVKTLTRTIRYARSLRVPVLVHVRTVKGKGYTPAEQDPSAYHGVGAFDPAEGVKETAKSGFSAAFGDAMCDLAAEDARIVAVTAAMADGTGLCGFAAKYPDRFFDVGIAEGHAVSLASGMAKQGLKPVFAVYSSFLQRAYDMLIHDVALDGLPVVLAVDRAGLVGADGETHHGCFDVDFLCSVPGMRVYAPSNYAEQAQMLRAALSGSGPAAVRYPRGAEGAFREDTSAKSAAVLREGTDVTVVSYGTLINEALKAAEMLEASGISAGVVKLNLISAPETEEVMDALKRTGRLVSAEECCESGCVGRRLLAACVTRGIPMKSAKLLNLGSGVVTHGSTETLRRVCGIDAVHIAHSCEELLK